MDFAWVYWRWRGLWKRVVYLDEATIEHNPNPVSGRVHFKNSHQGWVESVSPSRRFPSYHPRTFEFYIPFVRPPELRINWSELWELG